MVREIQKWGQEFENISSEFVKIQGYQTFLGMEVLQGLNIQHFAVYFRTYKNIWNYKLSVEQYHENFLNSLWKNIDLEDVRSKLENFLEEAEHIKKFISK